MNKDLSEQSNSYRNDAPIYQLFSNAEDFPDKAFQCVKEEFENKIVLDLGCGNGKYSQKISEYAKKVYAIDKSFQQLQLISPKNNIFCLQSDAVKLPFPDHYFDIIFCSWMFGTILDENKRLTALNEAKRVLKPGGKLILVENDIGSEFECLRGRYPYTEKTKEYNHWLVSQGLSITHQLSSYFKFLNAEQANEVFYTIWGNKMTRKITSRIVEHGILIFSYRK